MGDTVLKSMARCACGKNGVAVGRSDDFRTRQYTVDIAHEKIIHIVEVNFDDTVGSVMTLVDEKPI